MQESSIIPSSQNPKQKTLFTLMREALNLARETKQENIFLLGQSRSGKSTTFNWIMDNRILVGTGQQMDPVYQIKKQNEDNVEFAQVKKGFKSVTLIPNMLTLSKGLGLIDMPGTRDQRTQIHVMMVSFIYNVFLKFSKKAKFILVIANQGFKAPDSAKMVNLIGSFIKLFKCMQMSVQQQQSLFSSVSLLVTSVPIEQGKEQLMKTYYCKLLTQKLFFLKELKEYEKIGEIFPYMQMMLNNIIENKRIELFAKARFGESPQPCQLLKNLEERRWGTCELHSISEYLKFPYSEQFIQLSSEQQKNLRSCLNQKIQDYKRIQTILAGFVEKYLKSPINNTYQYDDYQDIYEELKDYYLQNLLQTQQQKEKQRNQIEQIEQEQIFINHSPILVLQNIIKLHKITFQIGFSDERQENQRQLSYFQYLKGFYVKTFDYIIQAFALTTTAKHILTKIKDVLIERMDQFMYISQIQTSSECTFQMQLKEAIQIMNVFTYREFQIVDKFCSGANAQNINQLLLNVDHVNEIIAFLNNLNFQLQESAQYFQILLKFYKMGAQKYKKEHKYAISLEYYLQNLINLIKLSIVYQIEAHYLGDNATLVENNNKINKQLQSVLYEIAIKILEYNENNYQQLEEIFAKLNILFYIQKIYAKIDSKQKNPDEKELLFLEAYMNYCQKQQQIQQVIQIARKLVGHSAASKAKKQQFKKRKKALQSKPNWTSPAKENQQIKLDTYLSLTDLVFDRVLHKQRKIMSLKDIQALISEKYRNRLKDEQNRHQFTVQLPERLTNFDIIIYSRYLISKIKNRKSIVLLGGKTGKSTVSYWLRGKQLLKQNDRIDVKNRQSLKLSTIKHKYSSHTQVPNIYSLNEEQLLIDAPHIYEKSPDKILIIGYILKQILIHSKETKFILVIREEDILTKQCIPLIQMLQFYIKMFKPFKKDKELIGCVNLLINFNEDNNKLLVRQGIKKEVELFNEQQKNEVIQQKHRLSRAASPCSRSQISSILNYIFQKGLLNHFDLKKKEIMINTLKQNKNWIFHQMKPEINQLYSSLNPTLELKDDIHQSLVQDIKKKFKQVQNIIRQLTTVLQTVWRCHKDKVYLKQYQSQLWSHLTYTLGTAFVQAEQSLRQKHPSMKKFKYDELQIPKIYFKPQISLLQLFSTIKITDIYSNDYHFYSMSDLKKIAKKVCKAFLSGVGGYFTKTNLLQIAWIKIWQILTELQILQNQTRFSKEGLSQRHAHIQYTYGLLFSAKEEIREQLFLTKPFRQLEWLNLFFDEFSLEQFKNQIKQQGVGFDFLYEALTSVKNILNYDRLFYNNKERCEITVREAINKLKNIQHFFIQKSPNDWQSAIILLEQCQIYINANKCKIVIGDSIQSQQQTLILTLENNLQLLCEKIASFDSQLALHICDSMQRSALKQKIFQILQRKQLLKRQQFINFYQLLIQNGKNGRAFSLVDSYKSIGNLQDRQYERLKSRAIQQKMQQRQFQLLKEMSLTQLQQIINESKKKLKK